MTQAAILTEDAYQREHDYELGRWQANPNVRRARKLLERPVFGNERHIAAVHLLSMVEEILELSGPGARYLPCPCCQGGNGYGFCAECGHGIDCHRCKGAGGIRPSEIDNCSPAEIKIMLETARKEAQC